MQDISPFLAFLKEMFSNLILLPVVEKAPLPMKQEDCS